MNSTTLVPHPNPFRVSIVAAFQSKACREVTRGSRPTTLHLALALIALSTTAVAGETKGRSPALAHPVYSVAHHGEVVIVPGTTSMEVLQYLGVPARKLDARVWAYDHFNGGDAQAPTDPCSILLITFQEDHVTEMQLVNPRAEKVAVAQIERAKALLLIATQNEFDRGANARMATTRTPSAK